MSDVKWYGDDYFAKAKKEMGRRLTKAAIFLNREIKVDLSVAVVKADGKINRSAPGEPPRKEYGELRRSMTYEVDRNKLSAIVGTNKIYGKYLELGTKHMAARPFLRPAVDEHQKKLNDILLGKKL